MSDSKEIGLNSSQQEVHLGGTFSLFRQGALDILPLSIAVLPWGILAGSMAINAGLNAAQAFAMSSIIFAGAAQLVSLGLIMSDASAVTIMITIFFLTSQHLIYALSLRSEVKKFPLPQRLMIGFLLTDEMFAVSLSKNASKSFAYLFGAGLCFYLSWCLFSALGMLLANAIPHLERLHLDFSIAALFILIIVPLIKNKASLIGVLVTTILVCVFKYFTWELGVVVASLIGMFCAVCVEKCLRNHQ